MADTKTKKTASRNGTAPRPATDIPDHPLARCKPLGDRVVVRRDTANGVTDGGILLPDSVKRSKRPTGIVWSVGPGRLLDNGTRVPVPLEKGQRVIITGYAGLEIRDDINASDAEEEFIILREDDIVAVIPH